MAAAVGRAWGWLRSWGGSRVQERGDEPPSARGWSSWLWADGRRIQGPGEQFWEAQEELQPVEIKAVGAGKAGRQAETEQPSRWRSYLPASGWRSYLPALLWWSKEPTPTAPRHKRCAGGGGGWEHEVDGDFSDYGTPPPSPTPPSQLSSPFRLFTHSLKVEVLPEHHQICFNLLRHLFDLFVVGFLWTVSPPTKLLLEVLGVQGPLRLWLHGMAMFLVSTLGMAGLLWWVQEYLPQFALLYGIVQALVISVSVRKSVILGVEGEQEEEEHVGPQDSQDPKDQPCL